ncbi:serine hydrolase [Nonomuraea phyllanthi]|uniref:Serine hydrolase n=1 Tax=Nonomuraea phyllanthi TaxID=2219224 RepID=A0A5C4WJM8_9ACTN|nr:serine hydrolase domain-containing protein [Nonomuraea phyllanthi]KAB8194447.1 serine hydrolase [Nonomuraea phyllanthi]
MDLKDRLDEAARRHGVPGAAIAVWTDGELREAATGVVNRATGVETTPDSVFQVGSTTKVWTAALVMQLVEDGLVGLDRPVGDHLPGFAYGEVTVRQLLTHTGGFDGDVFEDTGRGDGCLDRYVEHLRTVARVHEPGALFSYCNAGFCVLGALVARLRGTTWEQAMRDRLLGPLGATQAALFGEEAVLFRASAGHVGPGNDVYRQWQMPRSNAPAGSTMCLAPRELVAFGRALAAGGAAPGGARLLSAESVAAMLTPQVDVPGPPPGERWGLGVTLHDWGAFGHDGGTPGQSTYWHMLPEHDFGIAISANGGAFDGLLADVVRPVIEEATGVAVPPPPVPPGDPRSVDGSPYAGRYEGPQMAYEVTPAGGGLDIALLPGELMAGMGVAPRTARYVPLAGDTFIATESQDGRHETVTFVMRDGRAAYLHNGRAVPRV